SLNISLIADSKIQELKLDRTKSFFDTQFFILSGLLVIALIGFLFMGDHFTRQNEKNKLVTEAEDIVDRFDQSIDELTLFMQDTSTIGKVPEILKFLSNQKFEFPKVSVLTSDQYKNETVYLELSHWTSIK